MAARPLNQLRKIILLTQRIMSTSKRANCRPSLQCDFFLCLAWITDTRFASGNCLIVLAAYIEGIYRRSRLDGRVDDGQLYAKRCIGTHNHCNFFGLTPPMPVQHKVNNLYGNNGSIVLR